MGDLPNSYLEEAPTQLTEAHRIQIIYLEGSHPDLEETLLCLGKVCYKISIIQKEYDARLESSAIEHYEEKLATAI